MIGQETHDVERKTIAILEVLRNSPQPLGGRVLAHRLSDLGIDLGERAVRYHLKLMDERGFTRTVGRKEGRSITMLGIEELHSALVGERVGLVDAKIKALAYQSSLSSYSHTGKVPVNVSLFSTELFNKAKKTMKDAFSAGLGVGDLVAIATEGKELGNVIVPPGKVGLATISQTVICAALLRSGIPVDSRFGGMIQIQNHRALRFVELIEYSGCSLDPSEVFISAQMTDIGNVTSNGSGKILASLWEIPALARSKAETVIKELETEGIKGLIMLGKTNESVVQLPVGMNTVGMVLTDGLNPVAAAAETGIIIVNRAMSGVIDVASLKHFGDCL